MKTKLKYVTHAYIVPVCLFIGTGLATAVLLWGTSEPQCGLQSQVYAKVI